MKSFSPSQLYAGAQVPGGATFQSHGRQCVRTSAGYFYTFIHRQSTPTASVALWASLWFSPNGVDQFSLIDQFGPYSGGAPCVVADGLNCVYWGISNTATSTLTIRKYNPDLTLQTQANHVGLTSTKWTMMFCEFWGLGSIFTFSFNNNKFAIMNRDLSLYDSYQLTQNGPTSGVQYPWLAKSRPYIAAGWLTSGVTSTYDGIRLAALNSLNGHRTHWFNPNGGAPLALPIVADGAGPIQSLRQSFTPAGDSVWLGSMTLTHGDRIHATYSDPNGPAPITQTEVCYEGGVRQFFHDNALQGGATSKVGGATLTIQERRGSSSGYFKGGDGNLYLVGPSLEADADGLNWLNVLKSTDDGATWADFAQSDRTFNFYGINIMREGLEAADGTWTYGDDIVGVFTHITTPGLDCPQQVFTIKVPLAA
tara:strand:- start:8086 stop:9354 length:1269 start_codon:yes stop_codon:yes gene_type:complete